MEEIFSVHIAEKKTISKIYKEYCKLLRKVKNQYKNVQEI